jgi:hypothetical protein
MRGNRFYHNGYDTPVRDTSLDAPISAKESILPPREQSITVVPNSPPFETVAKVVVTDLPS